MRRLWPSLAVFTVFTRTAEVPGCLEVRLVRVFADVFVLKVLLLCMLVQ